jgi:hypothetical protein
MDTEKELRERLRKVLKSDMTVMLGLIGDVQGDARAMQGR